MSDSRAVAQVVNARMSTLGITQRELSERSGVSVATLRKIQQGSDQRRSATTLAAISRALGLPDDHLRKVAAGSTAGSATAPEDAANLAERLEVVEQRVAELRKRVAALDGGNV